MTHRQACRSTLPCRYPGRHTPTCSLLFHGVSSRCHLSYMKRHLHDSDLGRQKERGMILEREANTHVRFCIERRKNRKAKRNHTLRHSPPLSNHPANCLQLHSTSWIWRRTSSLASVWQKGIRTGTHERGCVVWD